MDVPRSQAGEGLMRPGTLVMNECYDIDLVLEFFKCDNTVQVFWRAKIFRNELCT